MIASLTLNMTAANAQPSTSVHSTPEPRRAVSVAVGGGSDEDAHLLEETIRELLARLQLTMMSMTAAAASPAAQASLLASVDVDFSASAGARVVVHSATGAIVIDRTVARDSTAAIQREQIAHAVRGAAEAELLTDEDRVAGRAPPVEARIEAPTALPPTNPPPIASASPTAAPPLINERPIANAPPSTGSALAFDLSTFGGAGFFADDVGPVARIGGSAALAYRRGLRPSIALAVFYMFPFETGTSTLTSRAQIISLRVLPSIEVFRRSRFGVDVSAGGGVDVLSVDPSSNILSQSQVSDRTTRADPMLSAGVTGRLAIASDVVLTLAAIADVDLTTRHYVEEDRGQHVDVLTPWTLRPMIVAGLSFTAIGEAPFETRTAPAQ